MIRIFEIEWRRNLKRSENLFISHHIDCKNFQFLKKNIHTYLMFPSHWKKKSMCDTLYNLIYPFWNHMYRLTFLVHHLMFLLIFGFMSHAGFSTNFKVPKVKISIFQLENSHGHARIGNGLCFWHLNCNL